MSLVSGSNSAFSSSTFFFLVFVVDVQTFFSSGLKFFAVEFLQLLHCIFIDRVYHVEHLQTFFAKRLQKRRRGNCCDTVTRDVVDIVLTLFHAVPH